jgi:glyoxylase-like metal-dependent hydrolase (beta-lactamase superfamily II)
MSFYLPPAQPGAGGMVFTGDALLIRGCGRTDFQQGNAGMWGRLYVRKLLPSLIFDFARSHLLASPVCLSLL